LQGTAQQKQWKVIKVVESGISCIACLDEQRCVIGGQERQYDDTFIMQTVDGGKTWTKIYADTGIYPKRALPLHSLAWISPDVIVVSADSSYIIRSTDAGKTWTKNRVYDGYYYAKPMYFCDDRNGILFEDKNVSNEEAANRPLVTSDGGATWRLIPGPKEPVEWSQTGIRTGACIAPGKYIGYELKLIEFAISRTADYGKTWDRIFNPFSFPYHIIGKCFFFLDSLHGWLSLGGTIQQDLSRPTLILKTNNGGESWNEVFRGMLPNKLLGFQTIAFTDLQHGIGTTSGRICRTSDGGASWTVDSLLLEKGSVTFVAMMKQEPHVIAGGGGLIAYLDESSNVEQEPPSKENFQGVVISKAAVGGYLQIEFISEKASPVQVWCDDLQGRRVFTKQMIEVDVGKQSVRVDVGSLPSGAYFITVQQGGKCVTQGVQITQ